MFKRPLSLLLSLLALAAAPTLSANPYAYPSYGNYGAYAPPQVEDPGRVLRAGIERLTGFMAQSEQRDPAMLRGFLEREIGPFFDFERMAYWSAGALNRHLGDRERMMLTTALHDMFLDAMAERLADYRHGRVEYLRPRGDLRKGNITLGLRAYSREAPPVQLDFKLYRGPQGWRVYDVMANGSSAVSHYRQLFATQVRQFGLQGVLTRLARRDFN